MRNDRPTTLGSTLFQKTHRGLRGAASGKQIVNDQNLLVGGDGIMMHFKRVDAVLQLVTGADSLGWKLSGFANRDKADAQPVGHRRPQDKAPALDPYHEIDRRCSIRVDDGIDRLAKPLAVSE